MKTFTFKLFSLLIIPVLATGASRSQDPAAKENDAIRIPSDLVTVDSQVLSRRTGQPIADLKAEDFLLLEDGAPQQVSHFSLERRKLCIVILLDISGSVSPYHPQIYEAALAALKSLSPDDDLALMVFDNNATLVQGLTRKKELIAEKLADYEGLLKARFSAVGSGVMGGTNIGDSLYTAAEYLRDNADPTSRRVIITVTDDQVNETRRLHQRADVTHALLESDVLVYGLTITTPRAYDPAFYLYSGPRRSKSGGTVDFHSRETGGLVFSAGARNMQERFANAIRLLRQRYSFGYAPSNSQMDGKFRKIKIRVMPQVEEREGGVIILTKQGYYARRRYDADPPAREKAHSQ
jgi:VWFA-related protein